VLVAFALGEGVKGQLPLVRLAVHEDLGAVRVRVRGEGPGSGVRG